MICKRIDLYDYFNLTRPVGAMGYLDTYVRNNDVLASEREPSLSIRKRPAMLIIPGGGYQDVSGREGEPIAVEYMQEGFQTFVLDYSVAPVSYPTQLLEACMAMIYVKENAKEFFVDTNHVCAIGFSAGGHLCGTLANMYEEKVVKDVFGDRVKLCRPDAVIYSYPVISSGEYAHKGSFYYLTNNDERLSKELSLEFKVTKNSPPAFIWSTDQDLAVPCENSLLMAFAYRKAGVPMELHIFEPGGHGLSTSDEEVFTPEPTVRQWIKLSKVWLKNRGFVINK